MKKRTYSSRPGNPRHGMEGRDMMQSLKPMHLVGKLHSIVYRVPVIGEIMVRGQSRATARLAFHVPGLGGKKCSSLKELRGEWLKFLGLAGIFPTISAESETEFEFELDACPYGFNGEGLQGVCDACMDLDRAYVKLLGGELEVVHDIPSGSPACRIVVRMA